MELHGLADGTTASRYQLAASQLRAIFSRASMGMMVISVAGDYLLVNDAFARLTGYTAEELYSKSYRDITHPDDLPANEELLAHLPEGHSSFELVKRYVRKDGSIIWVKKFATLIKGLVDGSDTIFGIVQDITQERSTEEQEQKLRYLIENISECIFISDETGRIVYMNKEARRLSGVPMDATDLGNREDYIASLDGKNFRNQLSELRDMTAWTGIAHLIHQQTGEKIPTQSTSLRLDDPFTGQYIGRASILRDLRSELAAQAAISEREERLRTAIELANLGTWSIDLQSGLITYSHVVRDIYGLSGEPIPVSAMVGIHPEDKPIVARAREKALAPGSSGFYESEHRALNSQTGEIRYVRSKGTVLSDSAGKPYLITGSLLDVTEHRIAEQRLEAQVKAATIELQEANQTLQRSNIELEQYAYVASHDLQEPLRKIAVFSGMLQKMPELTPRAQETTEKINDAANRMTLLIRDLLEFSRLIKAERMTRPVDLNQSLRAVLTDFELQILEKKATVVADHLPTIEAVGLQMNQLFTNLLSNALKFIREGVDPHIRITCRRLDPSELQGVLIADTVYYNITVTDNGIGFNSQYAEQIFEVFKRLHSRHIFPGTGIGLALCRRIVQNHGGTMEATSIEGSGTSISMILPATQPV